MTNMNSKEKVLLKTNNLNIKKSFFKTIIENVNISIKENDTIILQGQNGIGKTTLIEYLTNQIKSRRVWRIKNIKYGYVPQSINFDETVISLLKRFAKIFKIDFNEKIISSFTLEKIKDISFENISSGEKQRVMLAIAFLRKFNILILDEFLRGLDKIAQDSFYKFIKKLQKKYCFAIIYISHQNDEVSKNANIFWKIINKRLEVTNAHI